ncbi:MAG: excinuclease ABC subunit C [Helicobacteraceae bacterium 4484_230]|nr:MAG: excinuclease ABC subunit C [Helicobacteraceae bacterium 4484_230]
MLETIKTLPAKPGIYQYFDTKGRLLYIGKAKELSSRVKSYFRFTPKLAANPALNPRVYKMINEAVSLHYIVVESEHDALILENSLIKQLKPKYNILLRDDKTYPYIYIDLNEPFARFEITRKVIKNRNIRYFGPYSVGARDILDSLYELCMLVQKKGSLKGKKACLYYQMNKCLAPCEFDISSERYRKIVDEAIYYIEHKSALIKKLKDKMVFYSEEMRFEEAAALRDRIERISKSELVSQIDLANKSDFDIFAIEQEGDKMAIVRLFMRSGKIISSSHNIITSGNTEDKDELYERALLEFYGNEKPPIVAPILTADDFSARPLVQDYLSLIFEKKASIEIPLRGGRKKLVELARLNAKELLKNSTSVQKELQDKKLQELCGLIRLPERIEIFDNSHMAGEAAVGAMVVFDKGDFDKKSYRLFHLDSRDEYAQMKETLTRRIAGFEKNPPPDLWIIDGGTTLLSLARQLLESNGTNIDVIAISKEKIDAKSHRAKGSAHDLLHTQDQTFTLAPSDKRLQFVQRLRDEAHRFAIGFHQKTKRKRFQQSKLLETNGISSAKIKKLLNHFGTFESIYSSTEEEIASILSSLDAKKIKKLYK